MPEFVTAIDYADNPNDTTTNMIDVRVPIGTRLALQAQPAADWRDRLTVNLMRQGSGLTKTQIRALIAYAHDGVEPDPALFEQPAAASPFNGSAAEYADRFRSAHKRATTPGARVKRRHEIADAQISVLQSVIEELRRKARETPAWERGYFSSITSLEQQVALIQSNR